MNRRKPGWKRREFNAVLYDPTYGVSWEWRWRKIHIKLTAIWEAELEIWVGRQKIYRGYGTWIAKKWFRFLEDRYQEEQYGYDEEVAAAERSAGWDPNP